MIEEREFKKHADEALTALQRDLILAADDYGFESSLRAGAITVAFRHPPGKFTIAPDSATRQLKISLPARNLKLDWDIVENTFIHTETRETLKELLEEAISKHLKQDVEL
jgi:frataxin-like iron-binding protein CyaY